MMNGIMSRIFYAAAILLGFWSSIHGEEDVLVVKPGEGRPYIPMTSSDVEDRIRAGEIGPILDIVDKEKVRHSDRVKAVRALIAGGPEVTERLLIELEKESVPQPIMGGVDARVYSAKYRQALMDVLAQQLGGAAPVDPFLAYMENSPTGLPPETDRKLNREALGVAKMFAIKARQILVGNKVSSLEAGDQRGAELRGISDRGLDENAARQAGGVMSEISKNETKMQRLGVFWIGAAFLVIGCVVFRWIDLKKQNKEI
jgi:hypothetical protein